MKAFMDDNFLLQTKTAQYLFHEHAKNMPIYDFHSHLSAEDIANDINFDNIGQAWLAGDHYKWRLMRTNGIPEHFCTGNATDYEKFQKWAETVPKTMRNPLYHWTHLELRRYFNIEDLLNPTTGKMIYDHCSNLLKTAEYSVKNLLIMMNVKLICTTNDPINSLKPHNKIKNDGYEVKILPTFRPDKAMNVEDNASFIKYIHQLSDISEITIEDFSSLIEAIDIRHKYFHDNGCRIADHGVNLLHAINYSDQDNEKIFHLLLSNKELSDTEISKFKSAFLYEVARLNHKRGWVQQFHIGALRNVNTRLFNKLGSDIGCDTIGDYNMSIEIAKFLDHLDQSNELTKTVIYNLNPRDNEMFASMIGNFQDGTCPGKIQLGPSWWFLDQIEGITKQINSLSNLGLVYHFIGMTTDSRSFLSFPRHEYFRRILCNIVGNDIENGEIPADMNLLGEMIENICYNNAANYFKM
ncbi:MAG: glucuronate isomerase [Candidatus Lokiarchaeota archaeon]|nr:glucuronate isomerase [Candidatus Lokiarchaeota archaeon]